jgi:5'-nucleotidase/UDP-sugar diphosphatase
MRRFILFVALYATFVHETQAADRAVTLLHFSDYHSHAVPFFSEGRPDQGGIARAIRYMREARREGALVFNGGDMMNKGAPAWSDKYQCAEWSWLNGVVDAMAFGNHDADYGTAAWKQCAQAVRYPILSANTSGFDAYRVFTRNGVRIGVFAIAGPGFESLVKDPAFRFADPIAAAREAVRRLREDEKVSAVVMIGHEHAEDDYKLARAVEGIDLIFGSHSHLRQELAQIPGTSTWFISPYQYLTYISRVELRFRDGRLADVDGKLVRIDRSLPADRRIERRVRSMQSALERDPAYAALFARVGTIGSAIDIENLNERDSGLGNLVMDLTRDAVGADLAISTSSSFRGGLAAGAVTLEDLRNVLPYDNEILVYPVKGRELKRILARAMAKAGSDSFLQLSGVTVSVSSPGDAAVAGNPIDDERTYRVATTDYLAKVSEEYRGFFAGLEPVRSGKRVRDQLRQYIASHSPVTAAPDGRIRR